MTEDEREKQERIIESGAGLDDEVTAWCRTELDRLETDRAETQLEDLAPSSRKASPSTPSL